MRSWRSAWHSSKPSAIACVASSIACCARRCRVGWDRPPSAPFLTVRPRSSTWPGFGPSLAVGLVGGALIQWLSAPAALTEIRDGSMLAHGALARALNEQLAGSPASAAQLRIGLTFRARSGNYCRTFTVSGNRALFGLACRAQQQWQVLTLLGTDSAAFTGGGSGGPGSVSAGSAGSAGPAGAGASVAGTTVVGANGQNPRLSASTLPPALLQAVDERISGEPLNAAAELKARNNGWH